MKEMVSIVIPVYNAEKYLKDTIENIKSQTYKNWELILVNDCSTDDSKNVAKLYLAKNIKWIDLKKNSGPAIARNIGIKEAKGRYIAFQDADDLWDVKKLEKQVAFMQEKDCAFSFTGYEFADENGEPNGKKVQIPEEITYRQALKNTTISTITVMFDMHKLSKEDIMMPNVEAEDTATWWKVLKIIDYAYGLNEILSYYRRTPKTNSANKIVAAKRAWNLYRKVERFGIFKSTYYFSFYAMNAVGRRI